MRVIIRFKDMNRMKSVAPQYILANGFRASSTSKKADQIYAKPKTTSSCTDRNDTLPETIPFAKSKIGHFFQDMPILGNQFDEDVTLKSYLRRHMPDKVFADVSKDLTAFGTRVSKELLDLAAECEAQPPQLKTYHAWGKRVDDLNTCAAWKKMKCISAEEGLISIAYKKKHGQWSRLHQISKLYLFSPSSGLYSCPLAMTDGASKTIENLGLSSLSKAYERLTSQDPKKFWTSGQWMTERRGGSDVAGGTETLAVEQTDGTYKLFGYKWFSSATDSDMTMTLARIVDKAGNAIPGTKGLTMFYIEVRKPDGSLNNIEVQRLKDKLGTRQLPTAELLLDGVDAIKVSENGRGVATISDMLTITRLHNALSSVSAMRRILNLARDYSHKRRVFGKVIKDQPLHIKTLADMEIMTRGCLLLVLEMATLLGKQELHLSTEMENDVFRLLTPLAKLFTAKQAMSVVSEGLECFGGMGYLEDTGLPAILRDAQVLPIWEGTTNILSLDVLRAISKSQGKVLLAFKQSINEKLNSCTGHPELLANIEVLHKAVNSTLNFVSSESNTLELAARHLAFTLTKIYIGTLLTEHAAWPEATAQDVMAAKRWCEQDLTPVVTEFQNGNFEESSTKDEYSLVMDGYGPTSKL